MRLSLETERHEASTIVRLSGEIDLNSCDAFRTTVVGLMDDGASDVILDFTKVTFLDSSGLGALIGITKHADQAQASVALRGLSPTLLRLLEITHLRDTFTVMSAEPPLTAS